MRQKGQVLMFNDTEISLIKNTFADNEDLLYAVRKVLLQFTLSDYEKKLLELITEPVYEIIKKRVFPTINEDAPLTQLSDMYQTLNDDMKTKSLEDLELLFEAKVLEMDYLTQQFTILKGLKVEEKIKLSDLAILKGKDVRTAFIHTKVRNFILPFVDGMLVFLKNIAGQKTETVEEAKKRMTRDSSK